MTGADADAPPPRLRDKTIVQRTGQLMYELSTMYPDISGLQPEYGWAADYAAHARTDCRASAPHRNFPHHLFAFGDASHSITGAYLASRMSAATALRRNGSGRRSLRIPSVAPPKCAQFQRCILARMLKILLSALLSLSLAAPAFAQSQAANGTIEGTVSDSSGGVLPGVTVTITNVDTGAERVVVTNDKGLYRAPLLPLGTYKVVAELQGFKKFEADRHHAVGRPDRRRQRDAVGRHRQRNDHRQQRRQPGARRRAHRHRPHDDRSRSAQPAARRAQPVQLRARAAGRHRHRERRVRRAAPGRQRRRDAHQLPDRRQHQHREGSRRPAAAADVGSDDPGSEGRHHRLRARVRPDDGDGLQRGDAVGHEHVPRRGRAICSAASRSARFRSSSAAPRSRPTCGPPPDDAARPDTKVDTGTATVGGPIVKNKVFFYGGWEQTRRDLSSSSPITIAAGERRRARPQAAAGGRRRTCRRRSSSSRKGDYQINPANRATVRWIRFHNDAPYNSGGGLNSLERPPTSSTRWTRSPASSSRRSARAS